MKCGVVRAAEIGTEGLGSSCSRLGAGHAKEKGGKEEGC